MKRVAAYALLLATATFCLTTHAAEEQDEPKLTLAFDHAKLTEWVLEDFPDGLPFDRTGQPTDEKKATAFWQLIADWPISIGGEITGLRTAIEQISDESGLPVYYTKRALEQLDSAEAKKRALAVRTGTGQAIARIGTFAGLEQQEVTPYGLVILAPGDNADTKTLLTAPPKNTFRWRDNPHAKMKKAFPDGYDWEKATDEEQQTAAKILLESRCDLIVAGKANFIEFLDWFARASDMNIVVEPTAFQPRESQPESEQDSTDEFPPREPGEELATGARDLPEVQPLAVRFATCLEALNAALKGTGVTCGGVGGPALLIVPEEEKPPKASFRWRESWHDKLEGGFSGGTFAEGTPEQWVRLWNTILDTRCDLVIAEEMWLLDFLSWFCRQSQLNVSFHRFTLYASAKTDEEIHRILKNPRKDANYFDDEWPLEPKIPDRPDRIPLEPPEDLGPFPDDEATVPEIPAGGVGLPKRRKVQPVVFRNAKVRDVLNGVLKDFDLMVMEGSIVFIRMVPDCLTKEEVEILRRQDVESWRSETDSSE